MLLENQPEKEQPKTINKHGSGLPAEGLVRIWQITGCKKRGIAPVIPLGRSTFLQNLKENKYPYLEKIRLSERTTAYRVEDVRRLIAELSSKTA